MGAYMRRMIDSLERSAPTPTRARGGHNTKALSLAELRMPALHSPVVLRAG